MHTHRSELCEGSRVVDGLQLGVLVEPTNTKLAAESRAAVAATGNSLRIPSPVRVQFEYEIDH